MGLQVQWIQWVHGSRFRVQGSGLALGACCPLIVYEKGSEGSAGSTGSMGKVRRIKIWKRREVMIALRAHRHFEGSREISMAVRSLPDVRQHQDIVFFSTHTR